MSNRNIDNYHHNYIRDKKNFIRNRTMTAEEQYKHTIEKIKENQEKYGTNDELIVVGTNDRINGNIPQQYDDEQKQKSYSYGYFERGSSVIAGGFAKGICTPEEQREFGIRDLINGVKESQLRNLKDYPEYMCGRNYQKGRNIYEYIEKNNITIEEYIDLMSFIDPEITREEFKMGYYDEKQIRENRTKTR